jgi:hypothetical protein
VRGSGSHSFSLRADNLVVQEPSQRLVLSSGTQGTVEWKARTTPNAPWVAVVIPDGDLTKRVETISAPRASR